MGNNQIILSIVVPVYNVEKYLRKCVDSLLCQDIKPEDYEIILVDDGSTDACPKICDEYAVTNENIRVIHQENRGLSEARNTGIKLAQGKYIQFVDSDDWLQPNVLGSLVCKMEQDNLDVLRFNYQNVSEQGEVFEPNKSGKLFMDYRDTVCIGETFLRERLGSACYAWQFLLKHELTGTFTPGIYFEDTDWAPGMLLKASRVTSVDTIVYNYLLRSGSITQSVSEEKRKKILNDKLQLIISLQKQASLVERDDWFRGMIASTVLSILTTVAIEHYGETRHYIHLLKQLGVFPLSKYHLTPAAQRKQLLANLSPRLLCMMVHLKNG